MALYAIDIMFIAGLYRLNKNAVLVGAAINMALISVFAQRQLEFFGLQSNVGNVFYAAVIFAFSLMAYNKDDFMGKMHAIFGSMLLFTLMGQVISYLPVHNQLVADALGLITGTTVRIATASFMAFYLANGVNYMIINLDRFNLASRKVAANWAAQLIDSAIFFPVAFIGILPLNVVASFTVSGFIIKIFLNTIDTPVFMKLAKGGV